MVKDGRTDALTNGFLLGTFYVRKKIEKGLCAYMYMYVGNQWSELKMVWQKWSLCDPLQK